MRRFVRRFVGGAVGAVVVAGVTAGLAAVGAEGAAPQFGRVEVRFGGRAAPPASAAVCGLSVVAAEDGPQLALMQPARMLVASVRTGEEIEVAIPVGYVSAPLRVAAEVMLVDGQAAEVRLAMGQTVQRRTIGLEHPELIELEWGGHDGPGERSIAVAIRTAARGGDAAVRWRGLRLQSGDRWFEIPLKIAAPGPDQTPPAVLPGLRRPIEEALIQWDWRMQDGIGTEREPADFASAAATTLRRGDALIRDLQSRGVSLEQDAAQWQELKRRWEQLASAGAGESSRRQAGGGSPSRGGPTEAQWENLWRSVHRLRRRIALANPLARVGPLLFVKQAPGSFSHQLTQYLGCYARPGGGIFVLERPGQSMRCRRLADALPLGSYQHPAVSYDGKSILFAYCHTESPPPKGIGGNRGRYFHLYKMAADGSRLRQLTDGPFDDFSPCPLPNGQIVFIATRRGGWHRCGGSPGHGCPNYTLAIANADGSDPHPISFHETQEWDPAVLDDGRIIYTRWDYVDRHAVYYEQLWTARPDGTAAAIFYGNNTYRPVGIWEARQVPGSNKVMATAGAHHAMTAGSIILVDVTRGVDGPAAVTRLTPDALFPESETHIPPRGWHAPAGLTGPPPSPVEARRWPGHCYKSPYPLSESYFLAAYSFDSLVGEPDPNPVNMFGIYLVDRFGNKELVYRDLNISSLWPIPLRARPRPAVAQSASVRSQRPEGVFIVQNVYRSDPPLPAGSIKRLRILQVLPKSTAGINWPRLGIPNASPGKQVLGTVPVEPDGSAHFRAPAGIPLTLQALDERGRAVQIMRSVVYLQPGEVVACTGCHEPRNTAPPPGRLAQALRRPPSTIQPGPDGSRPFSYPILVQPVLDKHCVRCHSPEKPEGKVVLTGQPQGHFTVSYNALAGRVPYSAWGGKPGDFRQVNSEPISRPGFFGAKGSRLMDMLLAGHYDVVLGDEDIERLVTWMDANVLFYGTFNHADQARQQRGERIAGPDFQ